MQRDDLLEKRAFGACDIPDRLSWYRFRHEADEVAGMAGLHCNADLAVGLEAADARTVTGARIDYDKGAARQIDLDAAGRFHAHQAVIHRPLQVPAVRD